MGGAAVECAPLFIDSAHAGAGAGGCEGAALRSTADQFDAEATTEPCHHTIKITGMLGCRKMKLGIYDKVLW